MFHEECEVNPKVLHPLAQQALDAIDEEARTLDSMVAEFAEEDPFCPRYEDFQAAKEHHDWCSCQDIFSLMAGAVSSRTAYTQDRINHALELFHSVGTSFTSINRESVGRTGKALGIVRSLECELINQAEEGLRHLRHGVARYREQLTRDRPVATFGTVTDLVGDTGVFVHPNARQRAFAHLASATSPNSILSMGMHAGDPLSDLVSARGVIGVKNYFTLPDSEPKFLAAVAKYPQHATVIAEAFVAAQEDPKLGDVIIQLMEQLPENDLVEVLSAYRNLGLILDELQEWSSLIKDAEGPKHHPTAQYFLTNINGILTRVQLADDIDAERLLVRAVITDAELVLYGALYRAHGSPSSIDQSGLRGVDHVVVEARNLSREQKEELRLLASDGCFDLHEQLVGENNFHRFCESLVYLDGRYHLLVIDGKIAACVQYLDCTDRLLARSFYARNEIWHTRMARAFFRRSTEIETTGGRDIWAHCFSDNPMLKVYCEQFGFVIAETIVDYYPNRLFYLIVKRTHSITGTGS
jgi:hypothetical protein